MFARVNFAGKYTAEVKREKHLTTTPPLAGQADTNPACGPAAGPSTLTRACGGAGEHKGRKDVGWAG